MNFESSVVVSKGKKNPTGRETVCAFANSAKSRVTIPFSSPRGWDCAL